MVFRCQWIRELDVLKIVEVQARLRAFGMLVMRPFDLTVEIFEPEVKVGSLIGLCETLYCE
jgi:hypothetical protein